MNPIKVAKKYNCSVKSAIERIRIIKQQGIPLKSAWDNDLFYMNPSKLRKYFASPKLRMYSQLIAEKEGATEYEVYKQIKRARIRYNIPYVIFVRRDLFNADESRLNKFKRVQENKRSGTIKKIAEAANISSDEAQEWAADIKKRYGLGAEFCYSHQLYKMTDEEIAEVAANRKKRIAQKRKIALEESGWTNTQLNAHMAKCSQKFHIGNDYYYSLRCYKFSDDQLKGVLCHEDINKIAGKFNKRIERVDEKDQFCKNYKDYLGRKVWSNSDTTFEEFQKFVEGLDEIFVKPVDGKHGNGARKIALKDHDIEELYKELMDGCDVVAEEVIHQHPKMAEFNPTSINTLRIYTIQNGDEVDVVNAYARFGNGGIVDNYSSGGFECGVDPKRGVIDTPAVRQNGEVHETHPLSGLKFEGFEIPLWDDIVECVSGAIKVVDGINFVGWDVAVTPKGVVLVEGNSYPGPGAFQRFLLERGEPLRERFEKYL